MEITLPTCVSSPATAWTSSKANALRLGPVNYFHIYLTEWIPANLRAVPLYVLRIRADVAQQRLSFAYRSEISTVPLW